MQAHPKLRGGKVFAVGFSSGKSAALIILSLYAPFSHEKFLKLLQFQEFLVYIHLGRTRWIGDPPDGWQNLKKNGIC